MSLWRSLATNNVKSVHAKARNDCSDECKCKILCQSYKKHKEKERKTCKDLTNHQSWWTPVTPSWLVELTLVDKIDQLCHGVYHSRDGETRTPSTSVICPIVIYYCPWPIEIRCQIWPKSRSDWPRARQNLGFFRSKFRYWKNLGFCVCFNYDSALLFKEILSRLI